MDISNRVFELVQNESGLAANATRMTFSEHSAPYIATYTGANVLFGSVIVTSNNDETRMLYHALSADNELVAGEANVQLSLNEFNKLDMTLHWRWLTGDLSSGISEWVEVDI